MITPMGSERNPSKPTIRTAEFLRGSCFLAICGEATPIPRVGSSGFCAPCKRNSLLSLVHPAPSTLANVSRLQGGGRLLRPRPAARALLLQRALYRLATSTSRPALE